jgi:hypothetical protein
MPMWCGSVGDPLCGVFRIAIGHFIDNSKSRPFFLWRPPSRGNIRDLARGQPISTSDGQIRAWKPPGSRRNVPAKQIWDTAAT